MSIKTGLRLFFSQILLISSSLSYQVYLLLFSMRFLALGLAVPLFCNFAVSLPYQEDVENVIPVLQVGGDDPILAFANSGDNAIPSSQYNGVNAISSPQYNGDNTIQPLTGVDYFALTAVGDPQTYNLFDYLPSMEEIAAKPPGGPGQKPQGQKPQGQKPPGQKPPGQKPQGQTGPGQHRQTQQGLPNPGDTLPRPETAPGTPQLRTPGEGDPDARPDNPHPSLPWLQGDTGTLPNELLVYDEQNQFGYLGDYSCRHNGFRGNVVSPNHQPSALSLPSCSN